MATEVSKSIAKKSKREAPLCARSRIDYSRLFRSQFERKVEQLTWRRSRPKLTDNSEKFFWVSEGFVPRRTPAARTRLVEAVASLQRLRREMGRLSEMDEDYKKKKRALRAVIKELQYSLRR